MVSPADRRGLETLIRDRNAPQKHVWRATIVLLGADGIRHGRDHAASARRRPCVRRWQERFAEQGVAGLLRDKMQPSRIAPLGPEVAARVVALTRTDPPVEATHGTAAMMAGEVGSSVSLVQRLWRGHGLQPHRVRRFNRSNDPLFVAKLRDVVGLYVDPPAHGAPVAGASLSTSGRCQSLRRRSERKTQTFTWTADPDHIIAAIRRGH